MSNSPIGPQAMSNPQVSAIVPCFNTKDCVNSAIVSALEQKSVDVEVVVVDDGSTDGTADVVSNAHKFDERVRVIRLPENKGPSAARNTGIDAARGEWIGLLDADDRWEPTRLKTLLQHADEAEFIADNIMGYDVVLGQKSGTIYQDVPEGYLSFQDFIRPNEWNQHDLGYLQPIIRRSFLTQNNIRYDEHVRAGEDLLLNVSIIALGGRAYFVDEALYIYSTPVGAISREASPYTRSSVDTAPLIKALERLKTQIGSRLKLEDASALELRLVDLKRQAPIGAFHRARTSGDYLKLLALFVREPSVRQKVFRRVIGRDSKRTQKTPSLIKESKPKSPDAT